MHSSPASFRARSSAALFHSLALALALALPAQSLLAADTAPAAPAAAPVDRAQVLSTMKRATDFMLNKVSYQGGFVWSYLPDLSRRWGEMEAYPTMIWMQSPGSTEDVGQVLLDAYHATKDEYYYDGAMKVAGALILAQRPSGGWNYNADLTGDDNLKKWYATVGHNGWRLEEFQHYYGNSTYDDSVSSDVAEFMLRLYAEKKDPKIKAALDRVTQFILDSQYANGGWPQRFPQMGQFSKDGFPDYTGFITFNDDVSAANLKFLTTAYELLGDKRLPDAIKRGMNIFVIAQQPAPQAGWGLQHTPDDLKPASARTYEPKAIVTHTTGANIQQMIGFYYLTGDKKFLARLPEALDWLDSVKLPPNIQGARGAYPTFVEVGTNKPLFIHRTGSNVTNGHYFVNDDPTNTIGHYSSFRNVNVAQLREAYAKAAATSPEEVMKTSPMRPGAPATPLPKFEMGNGGGGGGGFGRGGGGGNPADRVRTLVTTLNADGFWPAMLRSTTHPYKGDGPKEVAPGNFGSTNVGDDYDTSPYSSPTPITGISTSGYVNNMSALARFVDSHP